MVVGYKFGTTIVPYNEEDQKEYGWKQENRCLKLIQFTKRSQVKEKGSIIADRPTFFEISISYDLSLVRSKITSLLKLNCSSGILPTGTRRSIFLLV